MQNLSIFIRLRNIFGQLNNKPHHLDDRTQFVKNTSKIRKLRQDDVKDMFDSKQNHTGLHDDVQ